MSLSIDVHVDSAQMPTLEVWREAIERLGYPMQFLVDFSPLEAPGCIACSYMQQETEIEYYFNEALEIQHQSTLNFERHSICEFRISSRDDEPAFHAAVAAAAALCILAGGTLEEADGNVILSGRVKSWAKSILHKEDDMTEQALSYPHPDLVEISQNAPKIHWWKFW